MVASVSTLVSLFWGGSLPLFLRPRRGGVRRGVVGVAVRLQEEAQELEVRGEVGGTSRLVGGYWQAAPPASTINGSNLESCSCSIRVSKLPVDQNRTEPPTRTFSCI